MQHLYWTLFDTDPAKPLSGAHSCRLFPFNVSWGWIFFFSKLALTLVQSQDWLILHKDKGGIRGLLQSLRGFSYKRCLYWQCGKRQLMGDPLVGTCGQCPFSAQRSYFSWNTHKRWYRATLVLSWWSSSWLQAGLALERTALLGGSSSTHLCVVALGSPWLVRKAVSIVANQPLGTQKLHEKKTKQKQTCSGFWKQNVHLFCKLKHSSLTINGGKLLLMKGPGGQRATACLLALVVLKIHLFLL